MGDRENTLSQATFRQVLRRETDDHHEALDRSLGALDLTARGAYATFLSIQYAARRPIENWAERNCPPDLRPPPQTALIAQDLVSLGRTLPIPFCADIFDAPAEGAMGLAWTLAGSAMGNRLLLKRVRSGHADLPTTFLSDDTMAQFLAAIRPALDQPARSEPALGSAIAAARAVFAYFASTTARMVPPIEKAA